MSARSKVERVAYGAYEVKCRSCKEEFEVSVCPLYCVLCGEKLERASQKEGG
jgi:hypothetical protein